MQPMSEYRAVARLRPASVSTPAAPARVVSSSKPVPRAGPPATSPGPTPRSAQRSFRPCPAHPHLLGPTHRRVAGCPRGESCRRAGRSGRQAPPSPYGTAFSEGSGSLSVLPGSSPITFTSPSSKAHQKSGPFAPPALPGLNAPTTLSDSRRGRRPAATLRPLPSPQPVSPDYPHHPSSVLCPLPRRIERVHASIASQLTRPSPLFRRVGIRIIPFEACSAYS